MSKSKNIDDLNEFIIGYKKRIKVFRGEKFKDSEQNSGGRFENSYKFEKMLKKKQIIRLDLDVIVEKKFLTKNNNNEISYYCVNMENDKRNLSNYTIPGGLYVTGYHKGTFESTKLTYRKMVDFIEANNLTISGNSVETCIKSYLTEADNNNYIIEISIKVKR